MAKIRLPNNWQPRPYQRPAWDHLENGGKRALLIWHRRSGKDDVCLHRTAVAAFERIGTYWHMLPEAAQGRKAVWDAVNPKTGQRRIDEAFPAEIRQDVRSDQQFIRFVNGSTWQVVGSDNYNSLIGSPPVGLVASEWPVAKPQSWAYLRPILAENDGWAIFIGTPRGRNHAYRMLEGAKADPNWFCEVLPAHKTGVFTLEQLQREKAELIREYGEAVGLAMYTQEYLCSFDAPIIGAIYIAELAAARAQGRVCRVPYDSALPVHTFWDIGIGDATAIWFVQQRRSEILVIDYYEMSGLPLPDHVRALQSRAYVYGTHYVPHDARQRDKHTTGKSYEALLKQLTNRPVVVAPLLGVEEGINAVRMAFPRMVFDEEKTSEGLDALAHYRRDFSEKLNEPKPQPVHDWSSHGADALRTMAVGVREQYAPTPTADDPFAQGSQSSWMAA